MSIFYKILLPASTRIFHCFDACGNECEQMSWHLSFAFGLYSSCTSNILHPHSHKFRTKSFGQHSYFDCIYRFSFHADFIRINLKELYVRDLFQIIIKWHYTIGNHVLFKYLYH